ncbi:MAG: hypothetical protein NC212_10460 [Staphylococcus sp.]|nr:hypothetical protein [Staphylococcus sp.]
MEKIITFIVVLALGSLYEFLKQRAAARKDAVPDKDTSAGKASMSLSSSLPRFNLQDLARTFTSTTTAKPHRNPSRRTHKKAEATPAERPSSHSGFLPGELLQIPTPEQLEQAGTPMEIIEPETLDTPRDSSPARTATDDEHYARWRRAIIDAAIITPKFKTDF